MRTFLFFIMLVLFVGATSTFAQDGVRRMKPRPYEYGRVVIDNFSSQANMAPVAFDHWLHRAKFTCRLCHVDIGFAMTAGATKITAADNMRGYFCGTCHNDRRRFGKGTVFASCAAKPDAEDLQRCALCHGTDRRPAREKTFGELAATLPRERLGNSIDWEGAEKKGLIHPVQYLDGESVSNSNLASQKDFSLATKMEGMPEIVFSHQKHTVWNGCELCHPEIFLGIKKGSTKYTMAELFNGKYCGVCHDTVAFPQADCRRCHTREIEKATFFDSLFGREGHPNADRELTSISGR